MMSLAITERPRIPPYVSVTFVAGDGIFLVSQRGADVFSGRLFESLIPLLNGEKTIEEIVESLHDQHPLAEIFYALQLLDSAGYITDASCFLGAAIAYRSLFGKSASDLCVSLLNFSSADTSTLIDCISHHDLARAGGVDLRVVLVDDYLDQRLHDLNQEALSSDRPWMIVRPAGAVLWIGPIFEPNRTGCWICLAERLQLNQPVERYLHRKTLARLDVRPVIASAMQNLSAALVINELSRWAAAEAPVPELLAFDPATGISERHRLVRRPQCAACGGQARPDPTDMLVREDLGLLASKDGGLRTEAASQTFERLKHHVSAITGVVSSVRRLETGDDCIQVYVAGRNFAATRGSLALLGRSLRSLSSGKGVSDAQAKTSALCEGIERYASVFQGYEPYRVASYAELASSAIHPNDCMLFSDAQYADRERWNARGDHFSWIPRRLEPNEELWWSPAWNLVTHTETYLPTAHVYFHSEMLADPVGTEVCSVDSNGHAAGRCYGEAILQGLFELVERDSVALWWYPRTRVRGVDLASFRSEYYDACLEYHRSRGRQLWVLDVTADLGIPTFVAVSRRQLDRGRIGLGFGAHLDAKTAINRAIGELSQFLGNVETWTPPRAAFDDGTSKWIGSATTDSEPYLLPGEGLNETHAETYAKAEFTVETALAHCIEILKVAGIDVFVADLTRPDVDLKVVKVVAPGLRHFWARFAPGRLFSVPVALQRLSQPMPENLLNQTPMFL